MIVLYADRNTEQLAAGQPVRKFVAFERVALRKIRQLQIAQSLSDLRIPPGNRLEELEGNWKGFWSVRINDQYRICFRWTDAGPADVQIVDYH